MKEESAKDVLIRLYGEKESYTRFECLDVAIEYAAIKLEQAHQKNLEIIRDVFHPKSEVSSFNDVE